MMLILTNGIAEAKQTDGMAGAYKHVLAEAKRTDGMVGDCDSAPTKPQHHAPVAEAPAPHGRVLQLGGVAEAQPHATPGSETPGVHLVVVGQIDPVEASHGSLAGGIVNSAAGSGT